MCEGVRERARRPGRAIWSLPLQENPSIHGVCLLKTRGKPRFDKRSSAWFARQVPKSMRGLPRPRPSRFHNNSFRPFETRGWTRGDRATASPATAGGGSRHRGTWIFADAPRLFGDGPNHFAGRTHADSRADFSIYLEKLISLPPIPEWPKPAMKLEAPAAAARGSIVLNGPCPFRYSTLPREHGAIVDGQTFGLQIARLQFQCSTTEFSRGRRSCRPRDPRTTNFPGVR